MDTDTLQLNYSGIMNLQGRQLIVLERLAGDIDGATPFHTGTIRFRSRQSGLEWERQFPMFVDRTGMVCLDLSPTESEHDSVAKALSLKISDQIVATNVLIPPRTMGAKHLYACLVNLY